MISFDAPAGSAFASLGNDLLLRPRISAHLLLALLRVRRLTGIQQLKKTCLSQFMTRWPLSQRA